ncbi:helix-turn-helix domain-containing protein [Gynuella sunshinyii]|uniref:Transposase n=1 Tax=Gynuella sunshinyii YC6258 TaxID=1445510 RepID=A0A0C5VRT0_9GAMM|nr:helix-turn-helix domain-containing protein [Gynuella sunshinyii]AJQ96078.1 transposase [Gynuella sunshinyii YC6258]
MKKDARQYRTEEQHLVRQIAVRRVLSDDESPSDVSRSLGLGAKTIFSWLKIAREKGVEALAPKTRSGRHRKLSEPESPRSNDGLSGCGHASIRSDDPLQRIREKRQATGGSHQWTKAITAMLALFNQMGFWSHLYTGKITADKCIECFKESQRS